MPEALIAKRIAIYFAVILAALIAMCIFLAQATENNLYNHEKADLFAKANIIAGYGAQNDSESAQDMMSKSLAGTGARGIILDSLGQAVYDSNTFGSEDSFIFTSSLISKALSMEQEWEIYKSEAGANILSVAVPINDEGTNAGAVFLSKDMSPTDRTIGSVRLGLIVFCTAIMILMIIIIIRISHVITSPLNQFVIAAQEISKGNFDSKLAVKGTSEIDQLANAMNYMCSQLELLEAKRRKFVSDASHELKTPMATIKLICDSITSSEAPDIEMVKDFLSDLSDEVDRLTRIIEKLLLLTKMDSKQIQLSPELTDFEMMLQRIKNKLTPMASNKNITLSCDIKSTLPPVMLDYDRIWEAIYNVVDNAIKYSKIGGAVKITAQSEEDKLTVKVYDSGKGIPDEQKDRIFERFYRLDDSRTRETGGTGLGLSIAKEALVLHGGSIHAEDNPEGGSCFVMVLPISSDPAKIQSGGSGE